MILIILTPQIWHDYAQHPEGWCDEYVFTTRLLSCFQEAKYETKKQNFIISPILQGFVKTADREMWYLVMFDVAPDAVLSFCECQRTPPARSYERSSCCQSDPAVHISPGPRREERSAQSQSRVRVRAPDRPFLSHLSHFHFAHIRSQKQDGSGQKDTVASEGFFTELPQFSFIHSLNTSSSIKFSLSQIRFGWRIRVIGWLLSH